MPGCALSASARVSFHKIFGWIWPVQPSELRNRVLQLRLGGALITAPGFVALRADVEALFGHLTGPGAARGY